MSWKSSDPVWPHDNPNCPTCDRPGGQHEEWCEIGADWTPRRLGWLRDILFDQTLRRALIFVILVGVLLVLFFTSCVVGRLDSGHLRIIPASEVHRMDDKGFPLNLFRHGKRTSFTNRILSGEFIDPAITRPEQRCCYWPSWYNPTKGNKFGLVDGSEFTFNGQSWVMTVPPDQE